MRGGRSWLDYGQVTVGAQAMFWGGVLGLVTVAGCTDAVCLPFVVATVTGRGWPSALRIQSVGFVCGLGRTLHWYTEQRDAGVLCEYVTKVRVSPLRVGDDDDIS